MLYCYAIRFLTLRLESSIIIVHGSRYFSLKPFWTVSELTWRVGSTRSFRSRFSGRLSNRAPTHAEVINGDARACRGVIGTVARLGLIGSPVGRRGTEGTPGCARANPPLATGTGTPAVADRRRRRRRVSRTHERDRRSPVPLPRRRCRCDPRQLAYFFFVHRSHRTRNGTVVHHRRGHRSDRLCPGQQRAVRRHARHRCKGNAVEGNCRRITKIR